MPFTKDPASLPDLDNLPKVPDMPQGCAWGLFDVDGIKDQLGTLNFLSEENTKRAASEEIKTGERIQLDWPLDSLKVPGFGRKPFEHKLVDLGSHADGRPYLLHTSDEIHINTQSCSQWDGFKHVAHQATGHYYNGLKHEDMYNGKEPLRNGTHNWCDAGGIAGRGVLVDWLSWYESKNGPGSAPKPYTRHEIPLSEIKETLKAQGTTLRPADILLIRSGFVRWHNSATEDESRAHVAEAQDYIGLEPTEEVKQWLWDNHFSAVGGDTVAFEAWPPSRESPLILHEWLLSLWGTPIGEMWDLEKLSEVCKRNQRYTFFLSSAPLRVPGGVASPPNAVAFF
ncbi:hypothetical protein IE53DRAFT_313848 [Violaceomyces palustris]|uniref:Uncharacterized protein n=1 Tax=Violaceomyces palustris TaxID=1673888 RepID=A0ACD0P079_9BASI|nr:hypothetical protein IE53DRAFT_313848 [Violaceomyces palustris]